MSSFVVSSLNRTLRAATGAEAANDRPEADADLSPMWIEALTRAMTVRDGLTHAHAQRVQQYAVALARATGISDLPTLEAISLAALLHDVGKLGIPDRVLNKPGPLTPDEYTEVKKHVIIGADLLSAVSVEGPLALIVRHHHENWDGTGYPDALRGHAIPVGARVLAIVDCYDALTSDRPYRLALSHSRAVTMIRERNGAMYDPEIADVFLRIVECLPSSSASDGAGRPRPPAETFWLGRAV